MYKQRKTEKTPTQALLQGLHPLSKISLAWFLSGQIDTRFTSLATSSTFWLLPVAADFAVAAHGTGRMPSHAIHVASNTVRC
jgi:hypothetical protein